jgi:hypothetical protein
MGCHWDYRDGRAAAIGNLGDYVRTLRIQYGDTVLVPIAGFFGTEKNLAGDSRVELLWATRQL